MKAKIGVVQARGFWGPDARKHTENALKHIEEGAEQGVNVLLFPEGYPGPFPDPTDDKGNIDDSFYDSSMKALCAKAKEQNLYVIAGGLAHDNKLDGYYTAVNLIGPSGEIVGTYRRIISAGSKCYEVMFHLGDKSKKLLWGDELPVFRTEYGNIGITVCSEIYSPELSRVLALKGADIIFSPSGGPFWTYTPTWKTLVWARAIENLVYVATGGHIWGVEEGIAMICSPEEIVADTTKMGIITADVDFDRLEWLRNNDTPAEHYPVATMCGQSSGLGFFDYQGQPVSRRPELYKPICMGEEELKDVSVRR